MARKPDSDKPDSAWIGNDRSYAGVNRQRWNEKMKETGDFRYVPQSGDKTDRSV